MFARQAEAESVGRNHDDFRSRSAESHRHCDSWRTCSRELRKGWHVSRRRRCRTRRTSGRASECSTNASGTLRGPSKQVGGISSSQVSRQFRFRQRSRISLWPLIGTFLGRRSSRKLIVLVELRQLPIDSAAHPVSKSA